MSEPPIDPASLSDVDRLTLVERIFIRFPRFEQLREKIAYCHEHSKIAAEPEGLLITGLTGAGKTTLCRAYEQQHPRRRTRDGAVIPVLSTAIPVPATAKSLATRLLATLGDPLAEKGSTVNQTMRLIRYMQECGVEIVLLDEFQHFIDRDSNHVLQSVANWLKDLLNQTGTPIVLVGMPYSEAILRANDQLERRFAAHEELRPFGWSTSEEQNDFRTLLATLDRALPFVRPANLDEFETAVRIHAVSGGRIGLVMKLVRRAAALAIRRGLEGIDSDALAWAFDEGLSGVSPNRPNPFREPSEGSQPPAPSREPLVTNPTSRKSRSRSESDARRSPRRVGVASTVRES